MAKLHGITAGALALVLLAPEARGQHEHHAAGTERLGAVSFPTSCAPAVKPTFERAVAMLHSFWFDQAERTFNQVAEADPSCAMAHWGAAMTLLGNPFTLQAPPEPRRRAALEHARRAAELAKRASHREQMYAASVVTLYDDSAGKRPHAVRMKAHEAALHALREAHPEDGEATIFYARAVIANAPPSDLTFARQLHAASVLEPLFASQPEHPGLAHYIIHTFDSPKLATHGLAAARRYASIAPSAPHALHMPSHIFTRLGYWKESIETNRRSANAEPVPDAAVHPLDYMVYAYLQLGQDEEARKVVEKTIDLQDKFYAGVLSYNYAALHARFHLERGAWAEAARLEVAPGMAPFAEAVTRFARAIGAARSGQLEAARAEVAALERLRDTLTARGDGYWPTVVDAQRLAASAWVAKAEGRTDAAVRLAREGAEREESVEKHPVTPGPLLPARELEAELLLELNRPREAMQSFEMTLAREPRRARALYGAARAADLAKERTKARTYYADLLDLLQQADEGRPELKAARAFLAAR